MQLKTRFRSTVIRHFSSEKYLAGLRKKARKRREKQGIPPTVYYFHQVDDPYSHLAVQKLDALKARYNVCFEVHLVSTPSAEFQGDASRFATWAWRDALSIAEDFQTHFKPAVPAPAPHSVTVANQILAQNLEHADFAQLALETGNLLWSGETPAIDNNPAEGEGAVARGNQLRSQLGHYQGAMFYFDGEWFWGVDRIRSLEQRLASEGFDSQPGPLCVPEPTPDPLNGKTVSGIELEYFPSLRSPYTAIGHQRVLDMIANTGVKVNLRPVMPMMMRGIPAPRPKQQYIITDSAREGREYGVPFGKVVDPFGEPVKRAFALFPAAQEMGAGMAYITAYLQAAWFDGIDITKEAGLAQVVENAGLDWLALRRHSSSADWQVILERNLAVLNENSLWGVPSFRVTGGNTEEAWACWGQDRIWRVASEIARRA